MISSHELAQQVGVETTVRVRDEGPRQPEHARIAGQRTIGQLWQLPVIAGWQVVTDLTDLRFDDVIVVDKPFCRRRDGAARGDGLRDGTMGVEQRPVVVTQSRGQWPDRDGSRRDGLGGRQAGGVLLQSLGAEYFCPDYLREFKDGFAIGTCDVTQEGQHQLVAWGNDVPWVRKRTSQRTLVTP